MHREGNEKMWLKFQTGGSALGGPPEQRPGGGAQLGLSLGWKEACSSVAPGSWGWCLHKGITARRPGALGSSLSLSALPKAETMRDGTLS